MATKIVTKNSSTASAVPTASDLVQGELAVNVVDKRLFTENNAGAIVELGTNPSTIDINAGTIDGAVIGGTTPAAITGSTVTSTGNIVVTGTVDGRDVAADGTKLDGIEASADVTDTLNVTAAGALMDSEVTNLAQVKAFDSSDYATAAQGTKVDGIEAGADVTDTANVTAAGALMDSELTSEASVKALNQGVATTDSPAFAGLTVDTDTLYVDSTNNRVGIGTSPLYPFHVQMPSDGSTGAVFRYIGGTNNPGLFFSTNESTTDCVINATGSTSANLVFSTTSERMRIDSSGNVGIGTTTVGQFDSTNVGLTVDSGNAYSGIAMTDGATTSTLAQGFSTTYLYNQANGSMLFGTNNTERMRIDSSGNVSIGTSATSAPLRVNVGTDQNCAINTSGGNPRITAFNDAVTASVPLGFNGSILKFETGGTERTRIDSSGNLLVGTTASSSSGTGRITAKGLANGSIFTIISDQSAYGSGTLGHIRFLNSNGAVGQISTSGSSTSYNTSSDYRLKENVVELTGATERLKQLNPSRFNFIADADTTVDGFLAHEVADVVPEAISGEKDAVDADGNPEYQGIDQSKLVPLLVATIQELEARITQLENN